MWVVGGQFQARNRNVDPAIAVGRAFLSRHLPLTQLLLPHSSSQSSPTISLAPSAPIFGHNSQ